MPWVTFIYVARVLYIVIVQDNSGIKVFERIMKKSMNMDNNNFSDEDNLALSELVKVT